MDGVSPPVPPNPAPSRTYPTSRLPAAILAPSWVSIGNLNPSSPMKSIVSITFSSVLRGRLNLTALVAMAVAGMAPAAEAQTQPTGLITGRVLNPATGEYIRDAEIRIEGTQQQALSEDGGYYRLINAPVGEVTVTATYTGHTTATAHVTVSAGATSTHDFELAPATSSGRATTEEVIKLGTFVVSTEREGQAKAVAEQKEAMNVKNVVAADNFGDVAEGNIGEFLKFMPGITLDYVETDTRAARMGGMEARYGYVTLDGNTAANTATGSFGDDTRQFEFEAMSINNIDSIEVNQTLNADMPADAPAGTINLRTKSALDRKGERFNYTFSVIGNQYENSLHKTPRPDDHTRAKDRPAVTFDYSNAFFDHKLGIAVNGSSTSVFKEQFRNSMTYDYTSAQAIAAGHPLITAINFKDGPKLTTKSSGGVKLDYQPFSGLRLSLASSYTYFSDVIANRNLNFRVSTAQSGTNGDLTQVVAAPSGANANTRLEQSGSNGNKKTDTTNVAPSFTYKLGAWSLDGALSYSRARGQNGSLIMGSTDVANIQMTRIGWTATRPTNQSSEWFITQTSGPSWYDLSNWGRSDAQAGNITNTRPRSETVQYIGQFNARYVTPWKLPTFFKTGIFEQVSDRHGDTIFANTYTYVGDTVTAANPAGNQLNAIMPVSSANFRFSQWGINLSPLPVPDKAALFQLQYTHPEYFTQTQANNVANLDTILSSPHNNQETIRAAYFMGNTRVGKWQLQAGERYEATSTVSEVPVVVPDSQNPFATKSASGNFSAGTTLGYEYYRYSKGLTHTYGTYDDFLPSASAKYLISPNLDLKLGYNKAIKRPSLKDIAGPITINSADTIVSIPNPKLTPEHAEKYDAMIEFYFEPASTISVNVFQTNINGAIDTITETAAEAGYADDPVYGNYEFQTFVQTPGVRRQKGIELSWSQQMTFLPYEFLRGFSVFATYSRYNSHPRPIENINGAGWTPQNATGGIDYNHAFGREHKFSAYIHGTWTDASIVASALTSALDRGDVQWQRSRYIFDVYSSYQFTKNTSVFISGRNAFNAGKGWYFKSDGRLQMHERYGGQWTVGVKGSY